MPIEWGEGFSFDQSLGKHPTATNESESEIETGILVIGGGLAGLTCAYRHAQGLGRAATRQDILVLEREHRVGGRVRSLKIESNVLNLGAVTFQPSAYPRYMALVQELGLGGKVRIVPRREMVWGMDGGAVHANNLALAADGLRSLVGRGLFTPGEAAQLLRFFFYMRRVTSPGHFDELLSLHDRSVAQWASEFGFSEGVKRKFIEPFIGFSFSAPENISAAFGVLLLGFNLSRPANLAGGMMQLPEAMAGKLGDIVETNAQALSVERDPDGFVTRYLCDGKVRHVRSKALVLAVPANAAAALVPEVSERASRVRYGNGAATLMRGKLKVRGNLHLWRTGGTDGMGLFGGEAQERGDGTSYFNMLTYRSAGRVPDTSGLFEGESETLLEYQICPAVAAPEPGYKPMPLDWGDGLFMAGDCTGIFPSQEAAVSSGEQVAELLRNG